MHCISSSGFAQCRVQGPQHQQLRGSIAELARNREGVWNSEHV